MTRASRRHRPRLVDDARPKTEPASLKSVPLSSPLVESLKTDLQKEMLKSGGRLSSLDETQNPMPNRNNKSGGKVSPTHSGEQNDMANKSESAQNAVEVVPPAGGVTDAELDAAAKKLMDRMGVKLKDERSYTQKTLDVLIPTAIIAGAVVGGVAVLSIIDNRWGDGARLNKLIDNGKVKNLALGTTADGVSLMKPSA